MRVSDILPGDIILFEGDDSSIDEAIRLLSGSAITHAALCYREGVLADAGPTGIALHSLTDAPGDKDARVIHLRRLPVAAQSPQPVLDAASQVLSEHDSFDYSGMVLVGLLLLYKKEAPSSWVSRCALAFLKRLAKRLDQLIQELAHPSQHPMFCSEFVFTCFQNAANKDPAYGLPIVNGALSAAPACRDTLLQRATRLAAAQPFASAPALVQESPDSAAVMDDELVARLVDALRGYAGDEAGEPPESDIVESVCAFDHSMRRLAGGTKADPKRLFLAQQEPFFVTPGDLADHCPKLQRFDPQNFQVKRGKDNLPGDATDGTLALRSAR